MLNKKEVNEMIGYIVGYIDMYLEKEGYPIELDAYLIGDNAIGVVLKDGERERRIEFEYGPHGSIYPFLGNPD